MNTSEMLKQLTWGQFDLLVAKFRKSEEYEELQQSTKKLPMRLYMEEYTKTRDKYIINHSLQLTNNLTENF